MNTKTIIGTTSSPNLWTYKIVITETATDTTNRTSTVKVEHFLGRKSGAGSSYFEGTYTIKSVVAGETKTSNKSMNSGTISAGGWKSIGSHTFTVSNTDNPTTINISGQQTSSVFNPSSSSASGTMDLTVLHLSPEFSLSSLSFTEQNPQLVSIGLNNNLLVYNLSIKKITFDTSAITTYDGATITTYNVYNKATGILLGTSNTNEVVVDFSNYNISDDLMIYEVVDSMGAKTRHEMGFYTINYTKPTLEMSTTTIKRKSSSTIGITDGYATIRLNGNFYKGNDVVGNNNTITKVEYKIWNTTEPSYTDITSSATIGNDGTITISGLDIQNISFTDVYNYKIVITDYFGNQSEIKEGTVPTGLAIWTEFADRVDFIKITKDGHNIPAPYVLYDNNTSRTDYDISLSDSSANYDYLEIYYIFYTGDRTTYNSVKIDEPNGKIAMLIGSRDNGTYLYHETADYTINGSTLERTAGARWRIATGGANSTRANTTSSDASIWITKVVGYK